MEEQLESIPDGLDAIYIRCLRRIDSVDDHGRSQGIALKVFRWVAFAKQALSEMQARHAVSMTRENSLLERSAVLSTPVTDYCANLVVVDDLTRMLTFPHPTVRDFLCDPRLPADLGHYQLSAMEANLWLGEICLAYARAHHVRKQMVLDGKQRVDTNITTPILKSVFGGSLPFGHRLSASKASRKVVQISTSAKAPRQVLTAKEFSLHEYMC